MVDDNVVDFEELEQEGGNEESPQKLEKVLKFLEAKLEPEDYKTVLSELGIGDDDMSNSELFAKIEALLAKKPEDDEEEPEDDEEKDMAVDQKKFIEDCVAGGKSPEECAEEYKKKYPEPAEEGEEPTGELAELRKTISELSSKVDKFEKEKETDKVTAKVKTEVDELQQGKHVTPKMAATLVKLGAAMPESEREELYAAFKGQKFTGFADVGLQDNTKPPGSVTDELTPERKRELMKAHGIDGLIEDKADKTKLPEWYN